MLAHERGRALAASHAIDPPADLGPVVRGLGLEVVRWRFAGRVREIVVDGVIGVDDRLSEPWLRWLTAHGIGHHLLHTGTCFYLESWQWVGRVKAERQAEEFAAGLLVPPFAGPVGVRMIARRYGIPEPKAEWVIGNWHT